MLTSNISIRGARTHNLKNIDLDLPRNKLIVLTGLSGSGKSSIAFDTIYAEGQRRYVESLSAYARQFLSMMEKPEVDHISGLSPAIAIQQKTTGHNPRSTVGTVTEIYDYLRVLYARVGQAYCPTHHTPLAAQSITQMAEHILNLPEGTRFLLLAPVVQNKKGEHQELLNRLRQEGYLRVRWNGKLFALDDLPPLHRKQSHSLDVVVDRLIQSPNLRSRLIDSIETTLKLSNHLVKVAITDEAKPSQPDLIFSASLACPECNYSLPHLDPRLFSFNNAMGACAHCNGLGIELSSIPSNRFQEWIEVASFFKQESESAETMQPCTVCDGKRLRTEAQHVFIAEQSLPQLTQLPLDELSQFFSTLQLQGQAQTIASGLLKEINARLSFLLNVGLEYLSLARATETLSGGEAQRIRLASQIGSGLTGVMYVLDEPSIGLHPRDNKRLRAALEELRGLGNTVIVVEHDEETMRHADYLVDIGPGAGIHGGHIVAQGTPKDVMEHPTSLTGQYLSGKRRILIPATRQAIDEERMLCIPNITQNNLQSVTLDLPLGVLTCITGVSGSGKSTLINQALYPKVNQYLSQASKPIENKSSIAGLKYLDKVIAIDQKPIGRTPRSNPATYIGLLSLIRELFAATPEARARGYKPGRFSFNVKGGRCNACEGVGVVKVEMHFLADIHVTCESCQGKRYNQETLDIQYKQKNIYDILSMTTEEAAEFFAAVPPIARKLKALIEVGLSYITLGQSATTFSGGEAQRIKLAKELSRRDTGKTLYILDEPTTGLHFYDIEQLLKVLHTLRNRGNTIVIIEHNLDVIKTADWVIDLGPEGGKKGGRIIASGTPETLSKAAHSYTGQFLKAMLSNDN